MRLTAPDLALIRDSKSHYTDLHLSIFQPDIVLQAQVNDLTIERGARSITFDNVTSGVWSSVKIGSTLLVGSSVGARDVGKVRIRSITSSVITVAENAHIKWANDLYLTVLDYFDVWPVYPRIIQDPSNAENTLWYKDYDIVYSNQNTVLGAFINIGPHRAAYIEPATSNVQLYYSASGTYPLSGAVSTYEWTFDGGNPATSSANTPGNVAYDLPGHYLTTFVVSGTDGWVETAYRYVSIYDREDHGSDVPQFPIQKWSLNDWSGSRGEGGWRASITVYEPIEVEEGSVAVLFADEWYGSTNTSLGGNAPNASKIKLVGYILDNSIRYNYKESSVTFEIGSITQVMKEVEGFSVSVESKASPTQWYELDDMTGKRAAYHYWKWHSNIISLADIEWIGTDYPIQYFDSDRESLFDAVDNFLRTTFLASAVADRQGKIYLETDAHAVPNATGTYTPLFEMTDDDWMESPEITEQRYVPLSYVEFGGIAYSGTVTGTYEPLMAEAPGSAPGYRGKVDRRQGLALGGQTQLNQLVGNVYTYENAQYPNIDFQMRGNYSNLDIAPQEALDVSILASDTARGEAIDGLYVPNNLIFTHSPETKTLLVRGGFKVLTTGEPGTTIVIPEVIDDGGYGGRGGVGGVPQIIIPSLPVASSVYSALKMETFGSVSLPIGTVGVGTEVPLTVVEFSSEGLPPGYAGSGTWTGANILPGFSFASGTYSPYQFGFVTSLPGIYAVSFNAAFWRPLPGTGFIQVGAYVISNTTYTGLLSNLFTKIYNLASATFESVAGSTILKLPANGFTTITVAASNSGLALTSSFASLEFMKYEP